MEKKINLDDFMERCKLLQPYTGGSGAIELYSEGGIKVAMIEFGIKLLELADTNRYEAYCNFKNESNAIKDTIKQVE